MLIAGIEGPQLEATKDLAVKFRDAILKEAQAQSDLEAK